MDNIANAISHLKDHQSYPATKAQLVAECNNLSDFSKKDKSWFEQHLADRTYNTPEDVIRTLGISS